jgi:hypothetical protein
MTERRRTVVCWPCVRSVAATGWCPIWPIPAKAAVLESGRQAAESLSATIGGWQALHPRKSGDRFAP